MPVISMFYGIIIRLYLIDNKHHHLPHIHAKYAEFEASIGIGDGEILSGELPRKQLRLVQCVGWVGATAETQQFSANAGFINPAYKL